MGGGPKIEHKQLTNKPNNHTERDEETPNLTGGNSILTVCWKDKDKKNYTNGYVT